MSNGKSCNFYVPWHHKGVAINECFSFYKGMCSESLSPRDGLACPFQGYPCAHRNDHPAPKKEEGSCSES